MQGADLRPVRRAGFSLIELAVVGSIIAVLTGFVVGAAHNARGLASDVKCLSNLRQVSVALRLYMMAFHTLPNDNPRADLASDLDRFLETRAALTCPEDHETPGHSYDPFYVARREEKSAQFVLGCPRHNGNQSALNLMSESNVQYFELANVSFIPNKGLGNRDTRGGYAPVEMAEPNQSVRPGEAIGNGKLGFEDGSTLNVSGDGKVVLVQSFRKSNGVLYTIVKIVAGTEAEVEVEVDVTPGSQFEVITPAAIAGVRGTRFTVRVAREAPGESSTTVTVQEGTVWVTGEGEAEGSHTTVDVPAGRKVKFLKKSCRRNGRKRADKKSKAGQEAKKSREPNIR